MVELIIQSFREMFEQTMRNIAPFTIKLVWSLFAVVLVLLVSGRVRHVARRGLAKSRADAHTQYIADRIMGWAAVAIALIWIAAILGIDLTALAAIIGVFTVAMSLAFQDVLKNFIAGVYLLVERPYRIGQTIRVKDHEGIVEEVQVRVTTLRKADNSIIYVPNALLFTEAIINRGEPGPTSGAEPLPEDTDRAPQAT